MTNEGYVRLTDVKAACFLWRVQFQSAAGGVGHVQDSFSAVVSPPESTLQTSEGLTIPCIAPKTFGWPSGPPRLSQADLAIVIYYRPWPITFLRCHRLFRFVARFNDKGEVVGWDKEPVGALEPDFDKFMEWRKSTKLPEL